MADAKAAKDTKVAASPEKAEEVVHSNSKLSEECKKPVDEAKSEEAVHVNNKATEEKETEDSKEEAPEKNGTDKEANGTSEATANGHPEAEKKPETESDTNGTAEKPDVCSVKRKSTGGDVTDDSKEVTSPKKAKLDEKVVTEAEANGDVEAKA